MASGECVSMGMRTKMTIDGALSHFSPNVVTEMVG